MFAEDLTSTNKTMVHFFFLLKEGSEINKISHFFPVKFSYYDRIFRCFQKYAVSSSEQD